MTNTELKNLSNAKLPTGGVNPVSNHRDVNDAMIDAFLGNIISDTQLTANVLTAAPSSGGGTPDGFAYNLSFKKSSGMVFFWGTISNPNSVTQAFEDIATISNTAYLPAVETTIMGTNSAGDTIKLRVSSNKFYLNSVLITDGFIQFNGFYPALN